MFQTFCQGAEGMKMNSERKAPVFKIAESCVGGRHRTDKCRMLCLVIREAYAQIAKKPGGRVFCPAQGLQGTLPKGRYA